MAKTPSLNASTRSLLMGALMLGTALRRRAGTAVRMFLDLHWRLGLVRRLERPDHRVRQSVSDGGEELGCLAGCAQQSGRKV